MPALTISAVDATANTLTVTAHGQVTGAGPAAVRTVGGTLPAPLAAVTDYWLIVVDANTVKLATSSANALSNTPIDLTTTGSGTRLLEIGIPYRRARTYVAGSQVKSADLDAMMDSLTALYDLLTAQTQSIWTGVQLAGALSVGGNLSVVGSVAAPLTLADQLLLASAISPSTLSSGNIDDYNPTGLSTANVLRLAPNAGGSTLRGLAGGVAGRSLALINLDNATTVSLVLAHDNAGSTAANRFYLANGASMTIRPNGAVVLWYDGTSSRWRVVSASL